MKNALHSLIKIAILLVLVSPLQLLAQLKVIDSLTKSPIQGVTIANTNGSVIQITNEKGELDVKKFTSNADQMVNFTAIGYQTKTLLIKQILAADQIILNPVTYQLNEVRISGRKYKKHLVGGGMTLLHGSNFYGGYGFEEARYFPNEYNEGSKIVAVQYFVVKKQSFQRKTKVDLNNAFGVGLYEANADGSPGKALLKEELVVFAKEHARWFEVNLEQYELQMPKYGFVVSFKVFPASFYNVKEVRVKDEDFVAPVLAIKTYLSKSNDSWRKGIFLKSKWTKDTFSHFGIRAMVAEAK